MIINRSLVNIITHCTHDPVLKKAFISTLQLTGSSIINVSFLTLYSAGIKQTITKVCITWLDVSEGAKSQTAKKKNKKRYFY